MPVNYMIKSKNMENKIWNDKLSGIPGVIGSVLLIIWTKVGNWLSTHAMLGNIKYHGKNILVMRGCIYRYPQWIELGDNVIIGKNTTMIAEICKEYDQPGGLYCR